VRPLMQRRGEELTHLLSSGPGRERGWGADGSRAGRPGASAWASGQEAEVAAW